MALTPGSRLGPYEVITILGVGGMGEVFRARDTKLNRDVALKVLPDSLSNDRDRFARFTREAQTLAALNHPNIAHVHGLEESGGVRALVMELVEGEDLSQRIARGAIPLDEVLPIAKQIAEALEAAHEQGIIHRDLKPGPWRISTTSGTYPRWSLSTHELLFLKYLDPAPSKVMAAPYTVVGDAFRAETPSAWSPTSVDRVSPGNDPYDLHPDGKRIATSAVLDEAGVVRDQVVFVFHFADYLSTIVPGTK